MPVRGWPNWAIAATLYSSVAARRFMPLTDGYWAKAKRENAYLLQQDLGNIRLDDSERIVLCTWLVVQLQLLVWIGCSIRCVPCQQCDLTWLQIQSSSSALHTCSRQYIHNLTTMPARSCVPGTMLGVMCDGLDIAVMGENIHVPCLAQSNPRLAGPYSNCFLLSSRRRVCSVRQGG